MTGENYGARRAYRLLGVLHFLLFGFGGGATALEETGSVLAAIATGLLVGGVFLLVFWRLANEHFRGDVPGEPGDLVYRGEDSE